MSNGTPQNINLNNNNSDQHIGNIQQHMAMLDATFNESDADNVRVRIRFSTSNRQVSWFIIPSIFDMRRDNQLFFVDPWNNNGLIFTPPMSNVSLHARSRNNVNFDVDIRYQLFQL